MTAKKTTRTPDYKSVDALFLERHSPRAMAGTAISKEELMTLFEAARWAPSSFNKQPWRFVYAQKGTPAWDKLFNVLVQFNQAWVKNAGALILIVSKQMDEGKVSSTASFDTGSAWQNIALQGSLMGLVIHAMSGFDYKKAADLFSIPKEYTIEAMVAVGNPADATVLPEQMRSGEALSSRKAVHEFAFEGKFKA